MKALNDSVDFSFSFTIFLNRRSMGYIVCIIRKYLLVLHPICSSTYHDKYKAAIITIRIFHKLFVFNIKFFVNCLFFIFLIK